MSDVRLPPFAREALAESVKDESEGDGALLTEREAAEALAVLRSDRSGIVEGSSKALPARLVERLREEVAELPMRYAPFFGDLCGLLDIDERSLERQLAKSENERHWRLTPFPGVNLLELEGGPSLKGAEALLVRFAPGARFPRHAHRGTERVLVLEGGYQDDVGRVFEAGDLDVHDAGTSHGFHALPDEPCITVTLLEGGIEFESWPLRGLMKLLGR